MLLLVNTIIYAGNPGINAMECVKASTNSKNKLTFKNSCDYKVFVVWCGNLKYSKKTCGKGKKDSFYTHSRNLAPYKDYSTTLKNNANYKYAVCKGGIGFGSKGIVHKANDNGKFTCTKTGSYLKEYSTN
jgi:hypothetical protein